MEEGVREGRDFGDVRLLGGRLALDFLNTVNDRVHGSMTDYLATYADLLNWSVHAGALTTDEAERLREAAVRKQDDARRVLESAVELRETIYRIFSGLAGEQPPTPGDLAILSAALAGALPNLALEVTGKVCGWEWGGDPQALDRMLWPVLRDAANLLTSDDVNRVRECPSPDGCGWVFLDTSKNRSRRWCSMETCGNAAKARRHYHRSRGKDENV